MSAGAATVLRSAEPALTVDQVKARILDTVDAVPALAAVTLTGGRLNLANMLTTGGSNLPPVADAGSDQSVSGGSRVTLDGSGSSDPDGVVASYAWAHVSGGRRTLNLRDADQAVARVRVPRVRREVAFVFELTVTDNNGATSTDTVTVTAVP